MSAHLIITPSEVQQFQRCRQQWDFVGLSRRRLKRAVGAPARALHLGSLVHAGLAENTLHPGDPKGPLRGLNEYHNKAKTEARTAYLKAVGCDWSPSEEQAYDELVPLAAVILQTYFDKWGLQQPIPQGPYLPGGTECTFLIDVPGTDGKVKLAGTFDGIILDNAGRVWVVDHKTFSQRPGDKDFTFHTQFVLYLWAIANLVGLSSVGGVIYDGILSKPPKIPSVLLNGTISKAKIETTPQVYRRAIRAVGGDPGDPQYAAILAQLEELCSGDITPYHHRQMIPFSPRLYEGADQLLRDVAADMSDPSVRIYPNYRWEGCWDCRVQDLCQAKFLQEDYEYLVQRAYVVDNEGYGTSRAVKSQSFSTITCVDDFKVRPSVTE